MELELKKEVLDHYVLLGTLTGEQEQSTESIVQDTLPDIGKILCCEGNAYLRGSVVQEDKAELSGVVEMTVVYLADSSEELRQCKISMPFQMREDCPKGTEKLCVSLRLEEIHCRAANPRKIHCKCRVLAAMQAYMHREDAFCSSYCGEEDSIECLQQRESAVILSDISERDFSYEDTLSFSSGRGMVREILLVKSQCRITEAKQAGNKASVKGIYFAEILVAYDKTRYETLHYELPFAQLVSLGRDETEQSLQASAYLTGMDYKLLGEENEQTLAISLFTHVDILALRKCELPVLRDLFSTAYATDAETQELRLLRYTDPMTRRQIWQETVELGTSVQNMIHIGATTSLTGYSFTDNGVECRTQVEVQMIYRSTEGKILSAERRAEVKLLLSLPAGDAISCTGEIADEISAVLTGDSVALRIPVDFVLTRSEIQTLTYIRAAHAQEEQLLSRGDAPSLVLRRRESGESLWSIAKRHNTTVHDILLANGCEGENELLCGKMLLIPRKRNS